MGVINLGERLSFNGFCMFVELPKGGSVRVGLPRLVYSSAWMCLAHAGKKNHCSHIMVTTFQEEKNVMGRCLYLFTLVIFFLKFNPLFHMFEPLLVCNQN